MNRPVPPLATDVAQELAASFREDPNAWLLYLRNSSQYALNLEETLSTLRAERQSEGLAAQGSISERDGIIRYQGEQLSASQQKITQLEIEKAQLVAAATPAVNTPQTVTVPASPAAAETHVDDLTRPATPATARRLGTSTLSEKIPDPKEFDGTRSDLRRFVQQIYGKMNANAD